MRYFSTFSGIGGFELGIQLAYEAKNSRLATSEQQTQAVSGRQEEKHSTGVVDTPAKQSGNGADESAPTCVGYSEIDKYATQIYQSHFPSHKNYGDITKIDAETIPQFDLLVGGFPCQAFSIAGARRGFEDVRGTLFFDLVRILNAKKPRLLLLENVKGLLSHDSGNTFKTIISTLAKLGYDLQWQVLNSKNHGVPQNRERVFIIGHLRGTPRPEVFPFGGTDKKDTRNVGEDVAYTIDANYHKGTNTLEKSRRSLVDVSYPSRVRTYTEIAPTVRDYGSGGNKMPFVDAIRRLTPIECERLQGFPDNWTEGVSDTQRYKCCGNAVTVNVIRDIMEKLL